MFYFKCITRVKACSGMRARIGHLYPLGTCSLWALVPFGHLHPLISARGAPTLCTCFNDWQAEHKIKIVQSMYNTLYKPYT